jgi:hypothetical protein
MSLLAWIRLGRRHALRISSSPARAKLRFFSGSTLARNTLDKTETQSDHGFYRSGWPSVQWQIRANQAHTILVRELTTQYPDVTFVDTQPGLDGEYEQFIDLIHFTREGDQQLAERFFKAITKIVAENGMAPQL